MKGLRIIALAFALCIGGTALAQGPQGQQRPQGPQGQQQGQRGPRQRMNPEQMAKMQTERYAKSLDLSEEQQKKLYDYNLNNIKKQQEEREKMRAQREQGQQGQGQRPDFRNMSEADREAFFKQMQEQRKVQEAAEDKAYKEILTEAQYKKWQKLKKQQEMRQRQMMQQRMGGGEGGFGGPGGQGGPGGGFGGGNDMGF